MPAAAAAAGTRWNMASGVDALNVADDAELLVAASQEEADDEADPGRKTKKAAQKKKKERKKRAKKKFRVCFSLVYVPRRDFVGVLGSRL